MDVTELSAVKDFTLISNQDEHIDTGSDNGHLPTPIVVVVDDVQKQELLVCSSLSIANLLFIN